MNDKATLSISLNEFKKQGGNLCNCKPITKPLIRDISNTDSNDNRYKWCAVKELFLPNPRGTHNFRIAIEERLGFKRLRIDGSIRKWVLGKSSIEDITRHQLPQFVEELAERLNLPTEVVWHKLKLSNIELGYNFFVPFRRENLIKHCVQYGRTKNTNDFQQKHESIYWNGNDKSIKIYDKGKEILANIRNHSGKSKAEKQIRNLIRKGLTICRIEVTYDDKNSFKKYGMLEISTLHDIYENWDSLHSLLVKEIAKIRIASKVRLSERMTHRQQEIAKIINEAKNFEAAVKRVTDNFYRSDENKARRKIFALMNEFSSPKHCSMYSFRKAIAKRLIFINRRREKLPLSDLFHILWRTSKGRNLKPSAV